MKLYIAIIPVMFSSLLTSAQVQSSSYNLILKTLLSHSVPELGVEQVKETKSITLLDAREYNEYRVSHIKDAKYVGYEQFDMKSVASLEKNQKIIVYCSVGYRSEKICEKLSQAGFTNVSNLYGGIFEWVNQGNDVVDARGNSTDSVHAYSKTWGVWLKKGVKVYDE